MARTIVTALVTAGFLAAGLSVTISEEAEAPHYRPNPYPNYSCKVWLRQRPAYPNAPKKMSVSKAIRLCRMQPANSPYSGPGVPREHEWREGIRSFAFEGGHDLDRRSRN